MSPTTPDIAHPGAAFRRGFVDALPICLGYFGVGFAIAAAAVAGGHPVWSPILQSLTHVSGTSQGAFSHRAIPGPPGGGWELFLLCVGLNLRYVLLALALAQRLPEKIGLGRRLLAACTVTDENVALAVSRPFALSFPYLAGVFASSYLGWNAGNALGPLPMWKGDRLFLPMVFDGDPRPFHAFMRYEGDEPADWRCTRL